MVRTALLVALHALLALCSPPSAPPAAPGAPPPDDPLAGLDDPATLSQLLQWSLKHQDLGELHERAEAVRRGDAAAAATGGDLPAPSVDAASRATAADDQRTLPERRAALDALARELMPDAAELLRGALARAADTSLPTPERESALLDLQDLVEDIDHAKDMRSLDGFPTVVRLLRAEEAVLPAAAAYVLGSAVKNQRELQLHLLEQRALPTLVDLLRAHPSDAVRTKALYALSAALQHCPEAQAAFAAADGVGALIGALSDASSPRLVRKSLALLGDLVREHAAAARREVEAADEGEGTAPPPTLPAPHAHALCGAIVRCLGLAGDLDAHEKAVAALEQIMAARMLRGAALDATHGCGLAAVRAALGSYVDRCEAALRESEGDESAGACEEQLPVARGLVDELLRME